MNLARFSCSPVSSGSSGLVNSVDWLEQKKDVDARHEVGLVIFCLGRGGEGENCLPSIQGCDGGLAVEGSEEVFVSDRGTLPGNQAVLDNASVVRQDVPTCKRRKRCFLMNFLRLGLTDQSRKQRRRHALVWNNGFGLVLLREKYFFDLTLG